MNELMRENILNTLIENILQPGCILEGADNLFFNNNFIDITGYNKNRLRKNFYSNLFYNSEYNHANVTLLISQLKPSFLFLQNSNKKFIPIIINFIKIHGRENKIIITLTDLSIINSNIYPELNNYNLFQNNPLGIISFDKDINIQCINKTAMEMFGIKTMQKNITLNQFIPSQTLELTIEKLHKCLTINNAEESIINCMRDQEKLLFCKWYIIPNKNLPGLLVYINDFTTTKTTEHNLFKEKSKVEAANQKLKLAVKDARNLASEVIYANNSKANFISNISHEIRTPLNAIMGFSEILAKEIDNPQQLGFLKSIIQSGSSLLEIINSILDYSKLEAGKQEIKKSEIHLLRFIEQSTNVYREICQQKNLNFKVILHEKLPYYIELDKQLFSQIVRNLLDNAIKFTSSGSIELQINCEYIDEDFINLQIIIKDSGIGIPKNQQEKIFYPFSQKDNQVHATFGGTGLGLSIVQKSVSLLSGTLLLKSKPNKGTTFTIQLPHIQIINREDEVQKVLLKNIDIRRINFNENTILIAAKTNFTRLLITNFLNQYSFKIIEATSFNETITNLSHKKIDLLIINDTLIKNKKNVKKLKEISKVDNISIVVFGTNDNLFINLPHCIFIQKPIRQEALIKAIARFMNYNITEVKSKKSKETITPKNMPKERIERMVKFLRKEILPKCKKYKDTLIIGKVENLCEEVAVIGEKNNMWVLINWAKDLNSAIQNFEIIKIKQLLQNFSIIIKEISSIIK